jgi:AAA domain, putative AbiEii toxin, Type IV TA system
LEITLYAATLHVYDFKCFRRAKLDLQYPGRQSADVNIPNVNIIVGDNGGGKSSVLRALAIAALAPALLESGFVPYRLVRRPNAKESLLRLDAILEKSEIGRSSPKSATAELLARLVRRGGSIDALSIKSTPRSPVSNKIHDDFSPTFFVVGYGATRRTETGEYSESSARRSRGLRYQRVASLFEDHVTMRPLQSWLNQLSGLTRRRVVNQINKCLPEGIVFTGNFDQADQQFLFKFRDRLTPFAALSDGYKAFIGWIGELVGHLCDVSRGKRDLDDIPGIVLVDEIDLHLHPEWQREVVPTIAKAFPKLQFIFTTHSPLITSTVQKENVFVTDTDKDGTSIIKQIGESVYGRSIEQILLSSYFGLTTTRPDSFQNEAMDLFKRAADGSTRAAVDYLEMLGAPSRKIARSMKRSSSGRRKALPKRPASKKTATKAKRPKGRQK